MQVSPLFYLQRRVKEMTVDEFASLFWLPNIEIEANEHVFNFDKQLSPFADHVRKLYYTESFNTFFYYVFNLFEAFKNFVLNLEDKDIAVYKGKYYVIIPFKHKE